ncbi:hypothetical protein SAVERM_280 [Streptomyces avermitilis MA-4680 = NBRC 14893]|uniref:Uncharacterized protein n=1 Tax=Streptomyces avermitilis (strain ATCC 31267 / DSM 46492 / JCM 5070 / NBRC 14893 / NCIMB 12804 / NRRL 8165 / MA-4680) TaxID=227882 RepID=Q82R64_STRAW|nr:hypothetical protein SAVERM_280 [Streptomyces avermitilis MA-4680 = NBRC 14893]
MAAGPLCERGVFSLTFFTSMVWGSTASPGAPSRYRPLGRLSRSCGRRKKTRRVYRPLSGSGCLAGPATRGRAGRARRTGAVAGREQ